MKTLVVSLPEALDDFVQKNVSSGNYASPSDVVHEGLRLLAQFEQERSRMVRATIRKGVEPGDAFRYEELSAAEIAERGAERLRRTEA